MPIPTPNLYPPFNILRLSHVILGVRDLAASRAFYVDMLGLQVTDEDAGHIFLRAMEERGHHCMVLVKSEGCGISSQLAWSGNRRNARCRADDRPSNRDRSPPRR